MLCGYSSWRGWFGFEDGGGCGLIQTSATWKAILEWQLYLIPVWSKSTPVHRLWGEKSIGKPLSWGLFPAATGEWWADPCLSDSEFILSQPQFSPWIWVRREVGSQRPDTSSFGVKHNPEKARLWFHSSYAKINLYLSKTLSQICFCVFVCVCVCTLFEQNNKITLINFK